MSTTQGLVQVTIPSNVTPSRISNQLHRKLCRRSTAKKMIRPEKGKAPLAAFLLKAAAKKRFKQAEDAHKLTKMIGFFKLNLLMMVVPCYYDISQSTKLNAEQLKPLMLEINLYYASFMENQ